MTKEEAIKLVKQDALALKNLDAKFINDKEVVLAAVNKDGSSLEYASDILKNNREIVLSAINEDYVETIFKHGVALKYASDELKNDREIALSAVNIDGRSLKYASEELKNDKEVVLASVNKDCDALEFASDELKNDKEVVLAALVKYVSPFQFASEELKNDKNIIIQAVQIDNIVLDYVDYRWQGDEEIKQSLKCSFKLITDEINGLNYYESMEHNLHVAIDDLPEMLSWNEANAYCEKIDNGWKLPSRKEFYIIYKELHLKNVCPIQSDWYWTRERDGYRHFDDNAFCFKISRSSINQSSGEHKRLPHSDRDLDRAGINLELSVRLVRTI